MPEGPHVAVSTAGSGPPVLVAHAWWDLNDAVRAFCDRRAARVLEQRLHRRGRPVTVHRYPGTRHRFAESDRPEYDGGAAGLARVDAGLPARGAVTGPAVTLRADPVAPLLASADEALAWCARRDLLGEDLDPLSLWELPGAVRILRRQRPDGSWCYAGGARRPHTAYDMLATASTSG